MFRLGLKRIMEPVAEYIEQRLPQERRIYRTVLRPPGALPEVEFVDTCYRCGSCVDSCPVRAIRPLAREDIERAGTPYVDPDLAACIACEDVPCTKACPSGALQRLESPEQIAMGVARVDMYVCLRYNGEDCRVCIDRCPMGSKALTLNDHGQVEVHPTGCTGCGVCQLHCPSLPKAIVVSPSSA